MYFLHLLTDDEIRMRHEYQWYTVGTYCDNKAIHTEFYHTSTPKRWKDSPSENAVFLPLSLGTMTANWILGAPLSQSTIEDG